MNDHQNQLKPEDNKFHQGNGEEMTDTDHRALAQLLNSVQGMVIVSGYACPLYDEIYEGWRRVERPPLADGARPRTEVLWLSPNIP